MKKLVFLSEESIFGGYIQSGLAELVDCLATSLTDIYEVNIVCRGVEASFSSKLAKLQRKNNLSKFCLFKVNYYFLYDFKNWEQDALKIVQQLQPDILHVLIRPEVIFKIEKRPQKTIYTFDQVNMILNKEVALQEYDVLTATSQSLLDSIYEQDLSISNILLQKNTRGISNALLTELFTPEKGVLLDKPYSLWDMSGKKLSRNKIIKNYNISKDACIFVTGALVGNVNMEKIAEILPILEETNSHLIIATQSDKKSQELFKQNSFKNRITYLGGTLGIAALPTLLAGADYFIQPDDPTLGNFSPLAANQYGTPPILSLDNHHLQDDFSMRNAIIVENKDLVGTVRAVAEAYHAGISTMAVGNAGMRQKKEWKEKKKEYIQLYEQ